MSKNKIKNILLFDVYVWLNNKPKPQNIDAGSGEKTKLCAPHTNDWQYIRMHYAMILHGSDSKTNCTSTFFWEKKRQHKHTAMGMSAICVLFVFSH